MRLTGNGSYHRARDMQHVFSSIKMSKRKQATLGDFGFTKRVCHFVLILFLLFFRAISVSMFLLSLFLIKNDIYPGFSRSEGAKKCSQCLFRNARNCLGQRKLWMVYVLEFTRELDVPLVEFGYQ